MYEGTTLLSLVGSVIGEINEVKIPADTDFELLYKLSAVQDISGIVSYGLEKSGDDIPENEKKAFYKAKNLGIMRCALQGAELDILVSLFEENKIVNMPLKGSTYRDIYPSEDMRTSADIDIFIDEKRADDVGKIMASQGYTKTDDGLTVDVYEKRPLLTVEIHKKITKDEKNAPSCLCSGYDGYTLKDGYLYTYEMSNEDSFVYMIWHYAKHFKTAGAGIRHAIDIYLFEKKRENLDYGYIKGELEKINLYTFYLTVHDLCRLWFEGGEFTEETKEVTDYVLRAGIFGTRDNAIASSIASESGNKTTHILRRLFPGVTEMKGEFKILRKCILLLPIFYIVRIFKRIFLSDAISNESSALSRVDKEKADKTKKILSDLGLRKD